MRYHGLKAYCTPLPPCCDTTTCPSTLAVAVRMSVTSPHRTETLQMRQDSYTEPAERQTYVHMAISEVTVRHTIDLSDKQIRPGPPSKAIAHARARSNVTHCGGEQST